MLIKTMYINNFRQFKGENTLDFSLKSPNNMTVIIGKNTYGKTTLIQAFLWCLYYKIDLGTDKFVTKKPDSVKILTSEIKDNMNVGDTESSVVKLVLIHEGVEYTILRQNKYLKSENGFTVKPIFEITYKQEDGQKRPIPDRKTEKVNNILPENLSDFFFFDAERIKASTQRKVIAESVRVLLGLDVLKNTIVHIGNESLKVSVIGKLSAGLDMQSNVKLNQLMKSLKQKESEKESKIDARDLNEKQIDDYQLQIDEVNRKLIENEQVSKIQSDKIRFERLRDTELEFLKSTETQFKRLFNTSIALFFANPVMVKVQDMLSHTELNIKGIRDINANSINDIIERGKCICGTEIKKNNDAYNHLMEERKLLPPFSLGTIVSNFLNTLKLHNKSFETYYENLETTYKNLLKSRNLIQEYDDDITELSSKITGSIDIDSLKHRYEHSKEMLEKSQKKVSELSVDILNLEREIETTKKEIDSLDLKSQNNLTLMTKIHYAREIQKWLDKYYKSRVKEITNKLQLNVSGIFNEIYHGKRQVRIDDEYNMTLHNIIGSDTDLSTGLDTIKNYAFVMGLIELAKSKLVSHQNEKYCLVTDAPFSNTDTEHIENVIKKLPKCCNQIIIFIMDKDWKIAKKSVDGFVKEFEIFKLSENYSTIKES